MNQDHKPYHHISEKVDAILHRHKETKKTSQTQEHILQCHHCQTSITISGPVNQTLKFRCPVCGTKAIYPLPNQKKLNKIHFSKKNLKKFLLANPIELILIILGFLVLINPTLDNIKISFTLLLIGTILLLFISESTQHTIKRKPSDITWKKNRKGNLIRKKKQLNNVIIYVKNMFQSLPDTIAIILIAWTLLLFVLTTSSQIEIYFIFIFIGFLITRELTDNYTSKPIKHRLDAYIAIFLISYIVIISEKIINIITM